MKPILALNGHLTWNKRVPMQNSRLVLILWTDHFDTVAATAFAAIFRKLGVPVKLVGPASRHIVGADGVSLRIDLTLQQALGLVDQVGAVVIPASGGSAHQLDNDPRIRVLLTQAHARGAVFITTLDAAATVVGLISWEIEAPTVELYPEGSIMLEYAYRLVERLVTTGMDDDRDANGRW
jgi:putative intracellular protease/amidase